jgi:hypothetical protein
MSVNPRFHPSPDCNSPLQWPIGGNSMNKVGSPAVSFELRDANGEVHRLEDYRGCWLLQVFHRHLG